LNGIDYISDYNTNRKCVYVCSDIECNELDLMILAEHFLLIIADVDVLYL